MAIADWLSANMVVGVLGVLPNSVVTVESAHAVNG